MALTGGALLVGRHPAKRKITNWITVGAIGLRLGCRFSPLSGHTGKATSPCLPHTFMFLSLSFFLPYSLSKNKYIKS